jgi:dolichol-phosphate mannosyltransferase
MRGEKLADVPGAWKDWRASAAPRMVFSMAARLWLFLPTYNEVGNLEGLVRATARQLARIAPEDWRLLVVDDASPDGTGDLADRLASEQPRVEVLHRQGKEGLGKAYLAGFRHALAGGAELVIVMDADFSHDPAHLPALVATARDSDLVLGSRYVAGGQIVDWPPLRRLLSRSGSLYARLILGVEVNDLTSGFRCVRRRVLETIELSTLRSQGYVFNIELTYRALLAGFRVTEVPIRFRDRTVGESKLSLPIAIEALVHVVQLRREAPERRASLLARRRRIGWRRAKRRGTAAIALDGRAADNGAPSAGETAASRPGPRGRSA